MSFVAVILANKPATISIMSATGIELISYWRVISAAPRPAALLACWDCSRNSSLAKLWICDRERTLIRLGEGGSELPNDLVDACV